VIILEKLLFYSYIHSGLDTSEIRLKNPMLDIRIIYLKNTAFSRNAIVQHVTWGKIVVRLAAGGNIPKC
jgi:hypothetical protein